MTRPEALTLLATAGMGWGDDWMLAYGQTFDPWTSEADSAGLVDGLAAKGWSMGLSYNSIAKIWTASMRLRPELRMDPVHDPDRKAAIADAAVRALGGKGNVTRT